MFSINIPLCEAVIDAAKRMYAKGLVNANEGNVSARDGDVVYITPTSVCKELLTPEMLAVTDLDGNYITGGKPSSEVLLHLCVYKHRPDAGAVVHDHSPYATAHAIARKPIETRAYPEMIMLYDRIPVVSYGMPGTPAVTAGIPDIIGGTDAFLLANHGLATLGKTPFDAFLVAEAVESIAKVLALTEQLGGPHELSDEEVAALYAERMRKFGKGKVAAL